MTKKTLMRSASADSPDDSAEIDGRFNLIFRSHLQHDLLDRETEASLAKQAQSEMAAWKESLQGLNLTGDEQRDISLLLELRKSRGGGNTALTRLLSSNYRIMLKNAFKYRAWGAKRGYSVPALFSLAFEGYLHAIRKFDGSLNVRLSTYSDHWMKQCIRRELHEKGRLIRPPYNAEIMSVHVTRSESVWRMLHGRPPTEEELLNELIRRDRLKKHAAAKKIRKSLRKQGRYQEVSMVKPEPEIGRKEAESHVRSYRLMLMNPVSMDAIRDLDGKPIELPDTRDDGSAAFEKVSTHETADVVLKAVGRLSPLERRVIELRFLNETPTSENMTLRETGLSPDIGLSPERIRQIQESALGKLRKQLAHLGSD